MLRSLSLFYFPPRNREILTIPFDTIVSFLGPPPIPFVRSRNTLTEATKELKWIRTLLAELGYSNNSNDELPTDLFSDNQSAIALSQNPVSHARAKHIDICHHFVREAIQDKVIWVQYVPTTEMTADSLTKALGREKHEKCTARMGMTL